MVLGVIRIVQTAFFILLLQKALTLTTASVAENSPAGTTVLDLNAATSGQTGAVTYQIVGTSSEFVVSSSELHVAGGATLDFEGATTSFVLTITAEDTVPTTVTATLTVSLTNVNEAPTFDQANGYVIYATSGAGAGVIGTVTATDVDADGIASYAITSGDPTSTFVVSTAGVISVDTSKTANQMPYVLVYEGIDPGPLTATTTVVIVPSCSKAAVNSIGIMALVTTLVLQAVKYL